MSKKIAAPARLTDARVEYRGGFHYPLWRVGDAWCGYFHHRRDTQIRFGSNAGAVNWLITWSNFGRHEERPRYVLKPDPAANGGRS